jgi:hypothetical protein
MIIILNWQGFGMSDIESLAWNYPTKDIDLKLVEKWKPIFI